MMKIQCGFLTMTRNMGGRPRMPSPVGSAWRTRFVIVASLFAASTVFGSDGITESPAPVFDTKLEITDNTGGYLWLDSDTLAITTYRAGEHEYWNGRVVGVSRKTKTASTLLEHGFLECANPSENVVTATVGSLKTKFWGPTASEPAPARMFFRWDSVKKALVADGSPPKAPWNWYLCRQTASEDLEKPRDALWHERQTIYLQARDGVIHANGNKRPVTWVRPNAAPSILAATGGEFSGTAAYNPFSDSYVLSSGQFRTGGGKIQFENKTTDEQPAVIMRSDGKVTRTSLPLKLKTHLNAFGNSVGFFTPSARGLFVYLDASSSAGGGMYLAQGDSLQRIWCNPKGTSASECHLFYTSSLLMSPDGCALAFIPNAFPNTVKIVELCQNE